MTGNGINVVTECPLCGEVASTPFPATPSDIVPHLVGVAGVVEQILHQQQTGCSGRGLSTGIQEAAVGGTVGLESVGGPLQWSNRGEGWKRNCDLEMEG